jgi:hypothetical protein
VTVWPVQVRVERVKALGEYTVCDRVPVHVCLWQPTEERIFSFKFFCITLRQI